MAGNDGWNFDYDAIGSLTEDATPSPSATPGSSSKKLFGPIPPRAPPTPEWMPNLRQVPSNRYQIPDAPTPPPLDAPGMHMLKKPSDDMLKARQKKMDELKEKTEGEPNFAAMCVDIKARPALRHVPILEKKDRSRPMVWTNTDLEVDESGDPIEEAGSTGADEVFNKIKSGVQLRKVKTDDRSKPNFEKLGLAGVSALASGNEVPLEEGIDELEDLPADYVTTLVKNEETTRLKIDLQKAREQIVQEYKEKMQAKKENLTLRQQAEETKEKMSKLQARVKELESADSNNNSSNCEKKKSSTENNPPSTPAGVPPPPPPPPTAPKPAAVAPSTPSRIEEDFDFTELDDLDDEMNKLKDEVEKWKLKALDLEIKYAEAMKKANSA